MVKKLLSGFVTSTYFRYVVASAAGWLALKLGLDPTEGKATIEGAVSALFALGMLIWGGNESASEKAVAEAPDGTVQKIRLSELPREVQADIKKAVAEKAAAK